MKRMTVYFHIFCSAKFISLQTNDVCNILTRDNALKMMMLHVICDGQTLTVISLTRSSLVGGNEDETWCCGIPQYHVRYVYYMARFGVSTNSLCIYSSLGSFPSWPFPRNSTCRCSDVGGVSPGGRKLDFLKPKFKRLIKTSDSKWWPPFNITSSAKLQSFAKATNDKWHTYNEKCNKEYIMEGRFEEGA